MYSPGVPLPSPGNRGVTGFPFRTVLTLPTFPEAQGCANTAARLKTRV